MTTLLEEVEEAVELEVVEEVEEDVELVVVELLVVELLVDEVLAARTGASVSEPRLVPLEPAAQDPRETVVGREVLEALGGVHPSVALLREAAERAPDVAEIRYHLAVALARSGAVAEARTLLQALVESRADFQSKAQARELLDE